MDIAIEQSSSASSLPVTHITAALGLSRATFYRRHPSTQTAKVEPKAPRSSHRALSSDQRAEALVQLHSPRFVDRAPAQVVSALLEEGTYICSERTMYRILGDNQEVHERRNQARHPSYAKPELVATAPNQVWTWDITKLKTLERFVYLHLYVMLDIFSRYVVGWMVAEKDNAILAKRFLQETIEKYELDPSALQIHSDRGSAMRSLTVCQMLSKLDVTQTFSRPRVSNDNPFSESQFKTVKYSAGFPNKFGGIDHAIQFGRDFFPKYNEEHHHSRLAYLTPATVHFGRVDEVLATRDATLLAAYKRTPERFARVPKAKRPPQAVYINPPAKEPVEGSTNSPEEGESDPLKGSPPLEAPHAETSSAHASRTPPKAH